MQRSTTCRLKPGLEAGLEVGVVRWTGDLLVAQPFAFVCPFGLDSEHPDERLTPTGFNTAMMPQRGVQCLGEEPQGG